MKLAVKIGTPQILIILLTVIAAVVHLFLSGIILKLNGLGYLGLLALFFVQFSFLPIKREWVRWALMGYAALTIVLYILNQIPSGGAYVSPLGIFTALVEVGLIFLLWRVK